MTVRTPGGEFPAGKGDALIFPRGPGGAHQVINTSDVDSRVLMISTMVEPDITEYPDSEKVGLFSGASPGRSAEPWLKTYLDRKAEVDYFNGEGHDE